MMRDAVMSARERILGALRGNRPAGAHPLPDLPDFPLDDGGDRTGHFLASLKSMGGKVFDGRPDEVLAARFPDAKKAAADANPETGFGSSSDGYETGAEAGCARHSGLRVDSVQRGGAS